jgi:hypothetical protein
VTHDAHLAKGERVAATQRGLGFWQRLAAGGPTGIAVVGFLAIRWPWDLFVAIALIAYIALLAALWRVSYRDVLILVAFVAIALFTLVVGILAALYPGEIWLPLPVLGGLALLSVVIGLIAVLSPRASRRGGQVHARQERLIDLT